MQVASDRKGAGYAPGFRRTSSRGKGSEKDRGHVYYVVLRVICSMWIRVLCGTIDEHASYVYGSQTDHAESNTLRMTPGE